MLAACTGDDSGGDSGAAEGLQRGAQQRLVLTHRLVTALQAERMTTSMGALGMQDVIADDPRDLADVRSDTDEAIADFEAQIADGGEAASAGRPAIDALDRLDEVRQAVDAQPASGDTLNTGLSHDLFGRYSEIVAGVLDATERLARLVTDPGHRRGAELLDLGLRQSELTSRLTEALIVTTFGPGGVDEPAEVRELSALYGEAVSGQSTVESLAAGTEYEGIAAEATQDVEASGFLDAVRQALEAGQLDVDAYLQSVDALGDGGWAAFTAQVADRLTR